MLAQLKEKADALKSSGQEAEAAQIYGLVEAMSQMKAKEPLPRFAQSLTVAIDRWVDEFRSAFHSLYRRPKLPPSKTRRRTPLASRHRWHRPLLSLSPSEPWREHKNIVASVLKNNRH